MSMKHIIYILPLAAAFSIIGCEQPCPPMDTLAPVEKLVGDYNGQCTESPASVGEGEDRDIRRPQRPAVSSSVPSRRWLKTTACWC